MQPTKKKSRIQNEASASFWLRFFFVSYFDIQATNKNETKRIKISILIRSNVKIIVWLGWMDGKKPFWQPPPLLLLQLMAFLSSNPGEFFRMISFLLLVFVHSLFMTIFHGGYFYWKFSTRSIQPSNLSMINIKRNKPTNHSTQNKTKNRSIDFCYEIVVDHTSYESEKKIKSTDRIKKSPTGVLSPCLCHNITWTYRHLYHCHLIITKKTLWETHRHRLNTHTTWLYWMSTKDDVTCCSIG